MPETRVTNRNSVIPDEYPARPPSLLQNEIQRLNSKIEKNDTYSLVILAVTYFIFGSGAGLYGPLLPQEAKLHDVNSYVYGPAIAINFLATVLFYPVACQMVPSITCRQSISMGIFMIGVCKVLFGTLALVPEKNHFIILSYGIQAVEGVGVAILLAATFVKIFSEISNKTGKNIEIWKISLTLGLAMGYICGEAVNDALGFSIPFYGNGVLCVLNGIAIAVLLPEPGLRINPSEMPVYSWTRKPRLLIYFLIIFTTLNYTGFLIIVLEPYIHQFHLNKVFVGVLFSIPAFSCILSALAWRWMTKKGVNSILLICIASLFIFASLILIGPAPFTNIKVNLTNVSIALFLNGFGIGGKLACVTYAATKDMRARESLNKSRHLISTMFACASLLGCFSGAVIAGFAYFYLGLGVSTYILLAMETICIAVSFVFAFKRNYTSPRRVTEETKPILESAHYNPLHGQS